MCIFHFDLTEMVLKILSSFTFKLICGCPEVVFIWNSTHFLHGHKGILEPFNVKVCFYLQFYRSNYSFTRFSREFSKVWNSCSCGTLVNMVTNFVNISGYAYIYLYFHDFLVYSLNPLLIAVDCRIIATFSN